MEQRNGKERIEMLNPLANLIDTVELWLKWFWSNSRMDYVGSNEINFAVIHPDFLAKARLPEGATMKKLSWCLTQRSTKQEVFPI